jgi:hypothetical protein
MSWMTGVATGSSLQPARRPEAATTVMAARYRARRIRRLVMGAGCIIGV